MRQIQDNSVTRNKKSSGLELTLNDSNFLGANTCTTATIIVRHYIAGRLVEITNEGWKGNVFKSKRRSGQDIVAINKDLPNKTNR